MHKNKLIFLSLLLSLIGSSQLYALPPAFFAGFYTDYKVDSESEAAGGAFDLGLYGFFSHRALLDNGGYISTKASATLSGLLSNDTLHDVESAQVMLAIPVAEHQFELTTAVDSSIIGSESAGAEVKTQWQALYRFLRGRRALNPYAAYAGAYLYQNLGSEDRMYHGGRIGFVYNPKLEITYAASLDVGMEHWIDGLRDDLLVDAQVEIDGLIGYFLTWGAAVDFRFLSSTDSTMSGFSGAFSGELGWNPTRKINLTLGLNANQQFLTDAQSLDTYVGSIVRVDYNPVDSLYLYIENTFGLEHLFSTNPLAYVEFIKLGFDFSF
ncbi:MAG: hypothetical protein CVV52_18815 [Spirochaetae bacterium HGW-Spirochaetae-8]|jgi:hypothetical protein|nr:MAG: hypothetical protein CVV52_18815 [Spirochaetae bacterium HGW-Spirochaetae-8]